ncbi:hypothetical protein ACOCJ5_02075 [Knoellia sp. CPCC 206450]|uniref:hypothetical protein n=1 Tax=Knoellia tibetensis TaxID=3404798 RepID=UPI003B42956C
MADQVVTAAAVVTCPHGGRAMPVGGGPSRVGAGGAPVMTVDTVYTVVGCPATPPCVLIRVVGGGGRVTMSGRAVLTTSATGTTEPTGERVALVALAQTRVRAG